DPERCTDALEDALRAIEEFLLLRCGARPDHNAQLRLLVERRAVEAAGTIELLADGAKFPCLRDREVALIAFPKSGLDFADADVPRASAVAVPRYSEREVGNVGGVV